MYLWSPNLSQISLKNSFGIVFFLIFIFSEIEMTRTEIRLFCSHFETVQMFYYIFILFFVGMWLWLVYVFMV